jgi:CheY-like chemotaxis protein
METPMNPRLLLLEDDVVSAAFLGQALAQLPVRTELAASLAQARELACAQQALWLFDARLPDGEGADLLLELRDRGLRVPALALTAEDQPRALQRLQAAGFLAVLAKPISAQALQAAVLSHQPGAGHLPWDDAGALAAVGGNPAAVQALRQLFLKELPDQARQLRGYWQRGDIGAMRELLHRLQASCSFVGAAALLAEVRTLSADPKDVRALERFERHAAELAPTRAISPGATSPVPTAAPTT